MTISLSAVTWEFLTFFPRYLKTVFRYWFSFRLVNFFKYVCWSVIWRVCHSSELLFTLWKNCSQVEARKPKCLSCKCLTGKGVGQNLFTAIPQLSIFHVLGQHFSLYPFPTDDFQKAYFKEGLCVCVSVCMCIHKARRSGLQSGNLCLLVFSISRNVIFVLTEQQKAALDQQSSFSVISIFQYFHFLDKEYLITLKILDIFFTIKLLK